MKETKLEDDEISKDILYQIELEERLRVVQELIALREEKVRDDRRKA